MPVHETNDAGLPDFVCHHPRVIVKFTSKECEVCQELAPAYLELSEEEAYGNVVFLKLDAADNPIASKEVNQKGTPFMVAYRDGSLIGHKLAASETDITNMLEKLIS